MPMTGAGRGCRPALPAEVFAAVSGPVSGVRRGRGRTLGRPPDTRPTFPSTQGVRSILVLGTLPAKQQRRDHTDARQMNIAQLKRLPSVAATPETIRTTSGQDTTLTSEPVRWYRKRPVQVAAGVGVLI